MSEAAEDGVNSAASTFSDDIQYLQQRDTISC